MVHPCWCEALPTMYRIPRKREGRKPRGDALLEASTWVRARIPGDMVNTSERSLAPSRGASQMRLRGLDQKVCSRSGDVTVPLRG